MNAFEIKVQPELKFYRNKKCELYLIVGVVVAVRRRLGPYFGESPSRTECFAKSRPPFSVEELIKSISERNGQLPCVHNESPSGTRRARLREISMKDVLLSFFPGAAPRFRLLARFCLSGVAQNLGISNGVPSTIAALYSLPAACQASLRRLSRPVRSLVGERFDRAVGESVVVPTAFPPPPPPPPSHRCRRRKYNIGR